MKKSGAFFVIFTLSGFSGLIYESIWTHYLKLFLGHAAYAQTLVLAIFMGGMAIGASLCSRHSSRWRNPLSCYAVTEGAIGLCALVFHPIFDASTNFAYSTIFPAIGNPLGITLFKWLFSSLLILPQSILLGMTFPLMSAAFLRRFPDRAGSSVAMLYFTNSIGAVFGVLVSGFLLIKAVGLPGTILFAGTVNIGLAVAVWRLSGEDAPVPALAAGRDVNGRPTGHRIFLAVALLTGAASFIYEIGWIRMLSLVLGSSTHAFELMLSAFILGLALGGLWIKSRINDITSPVSYLAIIQVTMAILALATLPLYNGTFGAMEWLLRHLPRTDSGYLLFNIASHTLASAVMLPATFCAGMTLPLITYTLLRQDYGERSVGAVYAANTVGAIAGVSFAVHVGFPFCGLKGLLVIGAAVDIAAGLLLAWQPLSSSRRTAAGMTLAGVAAVAGCVLFVQLDPYKMSSGVYRTGSLLTQKNTTILYHGDGKTATVTVREARDGTRAIVTNGKSDSAVNTNSTMAAIDELTTIQLGTIPLLFHPGARHIANIGLGTGLTSDSMLAFPTVSEVDTIEIEPSMVTAARLFQPHNARVFTDPRSRIRIEDAKTYFSTSGKRYDIIVSEPSNPWVSGVASLFSTEFYRLVNRHLDDDGLFVQWLQLYETDLDLVGSVLKAISGSFSDYAVYSANDVDIIIVAKKRGALPVPSLEATRSATVRAVMKRGGISSLQDLVVREIATKRFLDPFIATLPMAANSDYTPVLDQQSARARFMRSNAFDLRRLGSDPLPVVQLLKGDRTPASHDEITLSPHYAKSRLVCDAFDLRTYLLTGRWGGKGDLIAAGSVPDENSDAAFFRRRNCRPLASAERKAILFEINRAMVAYLTPAEYDPVWRVIATSPCLADASPAEKDYLRFFKALGERNPQEIFRYADLLLRTDYDLTEERRQYLLASGSLGAVGMGRRAEAVELWRNRAADPRSNFFLRFIVAQCRGGEQ